jgi:protein-disulfide isomerase
MSPQPNKPGDSKRTAREKAAQARAAAQAADRRRDRAIRLIGAVVVLAVVAAIVLVGVLGHKKTNVATNHNAALPLNVNNVDYGVKYGTAPATAPRLDIWEDFQCPICKDLEVANGAGIKALADQGKVQLYSHPANFIEARFPNSNSSSTRAAYAWGCAIDAGKTAEYHSGIFAMQSATEGAGYTDQQFLTLAQQVGITGNAYTTFQKCFSSAKYRQWVFNSENEFTNKAIPGTPAGYLNGVEIGNGVLASPVKLAAAVAAAGPAPSPSHS